mmetsp:Transcript_13979/g.18225  ORF Transcript_13979/g.18225 Transcript_13979/m.18225 type:complete len:400 (+) Transcript_13979:53-1252(+)
MMRLQRGPPSVFLSMFVARRSLVTLHGHATRLSPLRSSRRHGGIHRVSGEKPPDPYALSKDQQELELQKLINWFADKHQVLCLTGAGLSTESGIPDYRGHEGSYHKGHKPMVHDQFIRHEKQRKRYWGRGMVGWKPFEAVQPNQGHYALAKLEQTGKIGVYMEDEASFYDDHGLELEWPFSSGQKKLVLITQNVDSLHRRAGSKAIIELHGTSDRVKCMNPTCGTYRNRYDFHNELERINKDWLEAAIKATGKDALRPDGDAEVQTDSYEEILVPPCEQCGHFVKPDVVFFGDSVPKSRVRMIEAAVENCQGLLVVGSSLAVHSAFRHVRSACRLGIPVAVLNVGETRAEVEGLPILKIEAPAGATLDSLVSYFEKETNGKVISDASDASTQQQPEVNY